MSLCDSQHRCQKHVNAEKQFTLDKAPLALTIHLKRFTPFGKKLSHPIAYTEHMSLKGVMSDRQVRTQNRIWKPRIDGFSTGRRTRCMELFPTLAVAPTLGTTTPM